MPPQDHPVDFIALAQTCAPHVHPRTLAAIVRVESDFQPLAIGVVGGRLQWQPRSLPEALSTAQALDAAGWNFSVGLAQVNLHQLRARKLTLAQAFDPCTSLRTGAQILAECFGRARRAVPADEQRALHAALSCYYSGNFLRGFQPDRPGASSYVQRVLQAAGSGAEGTTPTAHPVLASSALPGSTLAKPTLANPTAPTSVALN